MSVRDWMHGVWSGAEETGLVVAAAAAPGTFEPSLVPRSVLDQALITGLTTTASYTLTAGMADLLELIGSAIERWMPGSSTADRRRTATIVLDVAAVAIGAAAQRAVTRRPSEAVLRGLVRQVGWRTAVTGIGGIVFAAADRATGRLDTVIGAGGRLRAIPIGAPAGLAMGLVIEGVRRRRVRNAGESSHTVAADVVRATAASVAVSSAVSAMAFGERALADATGALLSARLPGGKVLWRLVGHSLTIGGLVAAGTVVFHRAMQRIEAGTSVIEPVLDDEGGHRWVGPNCSGGAGSLVPWASLGREGRRHVLLHARSRPAAVPKGLPDLSVETVMGERTRVDPVLIYIGLDSAATAAQRVELALAEMDRTGAWDRSLLMLISPTGTGYVNYVATAAATYLTRGDIAMVTLQYSKRPSPLSLFKVDDAREQNRMLWSAITDRLRQRGGPRPKVVLFGESLGAHTSQDVLLHSGTLGAQALGIDRALWVGTPYGSGWMREVTGPPRPDVDRQLVSVVNDFGQFEAMTPERRTRLQYVLVSHDNDGVTKLGVDLVASRPAWLSPERPVWQAVPGVSPRGIPDRLRWRPITTFLQTLIDMKNAQVPSGYRAFAHDYRPDLTRFIAAVFDLPAPEAQLRRIEQVLEQRETIRGALFSPPAVGPPTT